MHRIVGWIVLSRPDLVAHLTIVDPVSLLLGLPDVAYNFLYRPPSNLIEGFILYGASREITISHMLHRHFWWHRNILYLEDIPSHIGVVVALSSEDPILNAENVLEYSMHCDNLRSKRSYQQQQQQQHRQHELASSVSAPHTTTTAATSTATTTATRILRSMSKHNLTPMQFQTNSTTQNCQLLLQQQQQPQQPNISQSLLHKMPSSQSLSVADVHSANYYYQQQNNNNNNNDDAYTDNIQLHHQQQQQEPLLSLHESIANANRSNSMSMSMSMLHGSCSNSSLKRIQTIYWKGYTHGQYLTCSQAIQELLTTLYENENENTFHDSKLLRV